MRSVTIMENGRDGRVRYTEDRHFLDGYWAFGGGDTVTIVSMGSREEWARSHDWAVQQRADILRFIADEVVRQRAPTCKAEIDEARGDILLRRTDGSTSRPTVAAAPGPQEKAVAFVRRYNGSRVMFASGLLVVALIMGAIFWSRNKVLMVEAVSSIPLNECVRTDAHIASLLRTTDPHPVEISGRGGNTTTSVSIVLFPLDGSAPHVVPVASGLNGNALGLSRILGSDGRTLWFDAAGLHGVRLGDYEPITTNDLREANPSLDPSWWEDPRGMDLVDGRLYVMRIDRSAALFVDPATLRASDAKVAPTPDRFRSKSPTDHLAAGLMIQANTWLALLSPDELAGAYRVGQWVKPVESAEDAERSRRLCTAELEAGSDGRHHRILRIAPLADTGYLNAAFLRMANEAEPLRLKDPDGALMIHTSAPGPKGTLLVSRVDTNGKLQWSTDTGLDRFALKQILPGAEAFAFVGTRPMVQGGPSEPLLVLVQNTTGKSTSYSLWR